MRDVCRALVRAAGDAGSSRGAHARTPRAHSGRCGMFTGRACADGGRYGAFVVRPQSAQWPMRYVRWTPMRRALVRACRMFAGRLCVHSGRCGMFVRRLCAQGAKRDVRRAPIRALWAMRGVRGTPVRARWTMPDVRGAPVGCFA
eukprot:gene8982-biopygen8226